MSYKFASIVTGILALMGFVVYLNYEDSGSGLGSARDCLMHYTVKMTKKRKNIEDLRNCIDSSTLYFSDCITNFNDIPAKLERHSPIRYMIVG